MQTEAHDPKITITILSCTLCLTMCARRFRFDETVVAFIAVDKLVKWIVYSAVIRPRH